MCFLTWPQTMQSHNVSVHYESKKEKRNNREKISTLKMSIAKYRHIMIEDNRDGIPFAEVEMVH